MAAVYGVQGDVQEVEEEHLELAAWQHMAPVGNLHGEVVAGQAQGSAVAMPGALHLTFDFPRAPTSSLSDLQQCLTSDFPRSATSSLSYLQQSLTSDFPRSATSSLSDLLMSGLVRLAVAAPWMCQMWSDVRVKSGVVQLVVAAEVIAMRCL